MSATFKRAAAFLIALCLTVGMLGQLVLADDMAETEEPAAEEVLEIEAESEDEELADIQLEEPESEEEEPSAEAAVESESSEDVEETAEPASEEEASLVLLETGWVERDGSWYYYDANGDPVTGWQTINGNKYYFDWEGRMYANTTAWIWDNDSAKDYVYRFDENGHMVTGWYDMGENYWNRWYYYNADGKAASGLTIVDGKQYYFSSDGWMYHDESIKDSESGNLIVMGSDGIVTDIVEIHDGWNQVGSDMYYYENGEAVQGFKTIDGYTYYFDWNGRMYADSLLWQWNEETGKEEVYRFDTNGHMVTGWYDMGENYWSRWYYYNADGKAANGLTTIDGNMYYFGSDGNMYRSTTAYDTESKTLVAVGDDGIVTETADMSNDGWGQIQNVWYYSKDGELVTHRWEQIGNYWYYFDWDGRMYADTTARLYDSDSGQDYVYRFDENGHMVTGWYQEYGWWYYYTSSGKAASGLTTVNGKKYYFFEDGRMAVNGKYVDGTTLYVVDGEGIASVYNGANGWVANTYYIRNGKAVSGWCEIDNYWYYFDSNGVYRNGTFYIDGKYYNFDSSGAMRKGWFKSESKWLYGDSSGALKYNEWMKSGNTWYYFDGYYAVTDIAVVNGKTELFYTSGAWKETVKETGKWVKNDKYWYYINSDGEIARDQAVGNYYVDYDGRMLTDEYHWTSSGYCYFGPDGNKQVSKWVEKSGDWLYFDENGKRVEYSWKKIGSAWYYFNNFGIMVIGDQVIDGRLYHFNDSGACTNSSGVELKNGWNLAYGKYYYYENGDILRGCLKEINGATYCFNNDGAMASDGVYGINPNERYYFTKSGAMLKNAWAQNIYGAWYYADSDGTLPNGLKTIGGKQYYFDMGRMRQYDIVEDDTYYVIGDSGVVTNTIKAYGTGWKEIPGGWIYCKDNVFPSGVLKINGAFYYFESGRMMTNTLSYRYGYFGSDGKLVKSDGWVKSVVGEWYYLENGSPAYGSRYIDGKWYYFGRSNFASDGVYYADGALYKYAGASGGRTKLNWSDGWNKSGNDWYYIRNGAVVSWELVKSGSKYYFLDMDGKMLTFDAVIRISSNNFKYLKSDGTFLKNGWKKIDGEWYYFGADGNVLTGEWTIDGVKYNLHVPTSYYGYMYGIG